MFSFSLGFFFPFWRFNGIHESSDILSPFFVRRETGADGLDSGHRSISFFLNQNFSYAYISWMFLYSKTNVVSLSATYK